MFSTKQTAEKLGVCEKTIFFWIKQGKIKATRLGRCWKISKEEIEYIKQNGTRE